MTRIYNRSEVLNFFDLNADQQKQIFNDYSYSEKQAEEDQYVELEKEVLPLSMFMLTNNSKFWDGIYSTSVWSAYFIKVSRCGTMAVIADRYF